MNPWLVPDVAVRMRMLDGPDVGANRIRVLEASPSDVPSAGTIVFIPENRGINAYIRDVTEGLASLGYRIVVPDVLSRLGGSEHFESVGEDPPSPRSISNDTHVEDLASVVSWLDEEDYGVVGFCYGGELAWLLAARVQEFRGLVVYYGASPKPETVRQVRAPFFGVYADEDAKRVNPSMPDTWRALDDRPEPATFHRFGGTLHAFHNHYRPERYHPDAARAAWNLTGEWLDHTLSSRP